MGIFTKSASVAILNRPCCIFQIELRSLLVSLITYNLRQNMPKSAVKFFLHNYSSENPICLYFRGAILETPIDFFKTAHGFWKLLM